MDLVLRPEDVVYPRGLSISVTGFTGDVGAEPPSQVFIELYKGKLRVHVWNGAEDPAVTTEIESIQPCCFREKPRLSHRKNPSRRSL